MVESMVAHRQTWCWRSNWGLHPDLKEERERNEPWALSSPSPATYFLQQGQPYPHLLIILILSEFHSLVTKHLNMSLGGEWMSLSLNSLLSHCVFYLVICGLMSVCLSLQRALSSIFIEQHRKHWKRMRILFSMKKDSFSTKNWIEVHKERCYFTDLK